MVLCKNGRGRWRQKDPSGSPYPGWAPPRVRNYPLHQARAEREWQTPLNMGKLTLHCLNVPLGKLAGVWMCKINYRHDARSLTRCAFLFFLLYREEKETDRRWLHDMPESGFNNEETREREISIQEIGLTGIGR
jgi:hypothetical protein